MVTARGVDRLIGVGKALMAHQTAFAGIATECYPTTEALLESGVLDTLHNDLILIKGARDFGFEQISRAPLIRIIFTYFNSHTNRVKFRVTYYNLLIWNTNIRFGVRHKTRGCTWRKC